MDRYEACTGGMEEMMRTLHAEGLDEITYRSSLGTLVVRSSSCKEKEEATTADSRQPEAAESGAASLVLLRSSCVGRWTRTCEEGNERAVEKGTNLGSLATLLGEEGLKAPGRGWVEKWIIGDGEVAGYGDPLALWREVI